MAKKVHLAVDFIFNKPGEALLIVSQMLLCLILCVKRYHRWEKGQRLIEMPKMRIHCLQD